MELEEKYDVIVVGAGHAGCEAAHCAATLGSNNISKSRDDCKNVMQPSNGRDCERTNFKRD